MFERQRVEDEIIVGVSPQESVKNIGCERVVQVLVKDRVKVAPVFPLEGQEQIVRGSKLCRRNAPLTGWWSRMLCLSFLFVNSKLILRLMAGWRMREKTVCKNTFHQAVRREPGRPRAVLGSVVVEARVYQRVCRRSASASFSGRDGRS